MKNHTLEMDTFINPAVGAAVSYHAISWNNLSTPRPLPDNGQLHQHSLPKGGTIPHAHEFAEIILVLSGSILHRVNGGNQELKANTIVFLRPSDCHSLHPAPGLPDCELLLLSFSLEFFADLSRFLEDDTFLHRYTEQVLPASFTISEKNMRELALNLRNLNTLNISLTEKKIRCKVLLLELLTRFFLAPERTAAATTRPAWLNDLCERMQKKENFIPGLKRMQLLSGYTPEYLCAVFRRHLGKTPTAYINELRLTCAARRLTDSDESIDSIARNLHFNSLSRFYRLFREQFGTPPADYRKRARSLRQLL